MVSPVFEKAVIVIGGLLCLAGLAYLYMHFPTQAVAFVVAAIAGTIVVGGLIRYFTSDAA